MSWGQPGAQQAKPFLLTPLPLAVVLLPLPWTPGCLHSLPLETPEPGDEAPRSPRGQCRAPVQLNTGLPSPWLCPGQSPPSQRRGLESDLGSQSQSGATQNLLFQQQLVTLLSSGWAEENPSRWAVRTHSCSGSLRGRRQESTEQGSELNHCLFLGKHVCQFGPTPLAPTRLRP